LNTRGCLGYRRMPWPKTTVKSSNFGPHGTFGPLFFFRRDQISSKRVLQRNEGNERCRKAYNLQSSFCSYFAHISPKETTNFAKRIGSKFSWGAKLEASTVVRSCCRKFNFLTLFRSYSAHSSLEEATDLAEIGSKSPWGAQLEVFKVVKSSSLWFHSNLICTVTERIRAY
jgi:hypothetical protein